MLNNFSFHLLRILSDSYLRTSQPRPWRGPGAEPYSTMSSDIFLRAWQTLLKAPSAMDTKL